MTRQRFRFRFREYTVRAKPDPVTLPTFTAVCVNALRRTRRLAVTRGSEEDEPAGMTNRRGPDSGWERSRAAELRPRAPRRLWGQAR
jgi:hypothetical protein